MASIPFGTAGWCVSLAALALTLLGAQPASASPGGAQMIDQYATAAVVEDRILHQALPDAPPETLADIRAVHPVGTPTTAPLLQARWILGEDDTAAVLLPVPRTAGTEALLLTGSWQRRDGVRRLHAVAHEGQRGLTASLDGLLEASGDGFVLKGVYTAVVRGARHVEWLALRLTPAAAPLPAGQVDPILDLVRQLQALEKERPHPPERLLSEPDEWIGGVPVPTNFDVSLSGEVDGVKFGPLPGRLLLHRADGTGEPALDLTLVTDGPVVPGWSFWVTSRSPAPAPGAATPSTSGSDPRLGPKPAGLPPYWSPPSLPQATAESGVAVSAQGGHIDVAITAAPTLRNLTWYTRATEQSGGTAPALTETGRIGLQVNGDTLSGTVKAEGKTLTGGTEAASTFSAEVKGRREAAELLQTLSDTIGA